MKSNHIAMVTGITGQDGAYLSQFLLSKGYRVVGTYRRTSNVDFWRLSELGALGNPNLHLVEFDLTDLSSAINLLTKWKPSEVYNLAAQSFVGASFDQPNTTAQITGLGALNLLDAIRLTDKSIKFYQASTSEMFGLVSETPQTECTNFHPRSPYAFSKLFAHWATVNYRESYGIFAASGILFNHESPLRGKEFVTRKITSSVAAIAAGNTNPLKLGNLNAKRDWGFAKEYVEGMWQMLQAEIPETYVLATNQTTTVREFAKLAFRVVGTELNFVGEGSKEVGLDSKSGRTLLTIDEDLFRPAEVDLLLGDPSKAKLELGWQSKTSIVDLCQMMVEADIDRQKRGFTR